MSMTQNWSQKPMRICELLPIAIGRPIKKNKYQHMKIVLKITLCSLFLFSIDTMNAQFGNSGFGNGNNRSNNGLNQINQDIPEDKPEEIPIEKRVSDIMERMKPDVNLDELQVIAISNVLKESIREQGILLKQKFSEEDEIKNFKALSEVTDRKIVAFLNKEQKEKYFVFKETKNTKKPNSKKKK